MADEPKVPPVTPIVIKVEGPVQLKPLTPGLVVQKKT